MSDPWNNPRAEGFARFLIAALVLLAPAVYTAKVALGDPDTHPALPTVRRAHTVLVTFGRWPMADGLPPGDTFDRIRSRSVDVGPIFASSDHAGAAAVSLLTGRYPAHHGVQDDDAALPEGTWTWASSSRDSGAATAVVSQAGFVAQHRIEGFDQIVEDPTADADQMAATAIEFLNEHAEQRKFLWLHVERPGAGGQSVASLLDQLTVAFDELDQLSEVMWIVTALAGPPKLEDELALRVPLFVELPTAFKARLTPKTHLSQVDLCGTFVRFLRQPWPRVREGQVGPQSRADAVETALGGAPSLEWVWTEGAFGHVVRIPPVPPAKEGVRIEVPPAEPGAEPNFEVRRMADLHKGPEGFLITGEDDLQLARQLYLDVRRQVLKGATKADRNNP